MTIKLDVWEIAYKNSCREDKVKEAIELFRSSIKELGYKLVVL